MFAAARPTLLTAYALADARHSIAGPVSILLSADPHPVILACGADFEVRRHPAAKAAERIDAANALLLPALANAHTHLDLTHIGPRPFDRNVGFRSFIDTVRTQRHTEPDEIRSAVRLGSSLLRQSGVLAVGDIAGAVRGKPDLTAVQALHDSGLAGVSYIEFFAMAPDGPRLTEQLENMLKVFASSRSTHGVGLQPHAPYSVSLPAYDAALGLASRWGIPISTHLAETPEESEFIASGSGPLRELLESLGVWHHALATTFSLGRSPVEHLLTRELIPATVVHLNQCSDADLQILAKSGSSVVYCPRASAYFGWERVFGPHRYRDMIASGVNVALGTDSIINLPHADRISILDEMRFLFERDGMDPGVLLKMATVNAAQSLRMDPRAFSLQVGATPLGIIAVGIDSDKDPLTSLMRSSEQPRVLWSRT